MIRLDTDHHLPPSEAARDFIINGLGLSRPPILERDAISSRYRSDLKRGVIGAASSLPMYDSHILPLSPDLRLPVNATCVTAEVGGTHLRLLRSQVNSHGDLDYLVDHKHKFATIEFPSSQNFLDYILAIDSLLPTPVFASPADALAIIWSFPGEAFSRPDGPGVDMIHQYWTKGWSIPDIHNHPIGATFIAELARRYGWQSHLALAVMNDTVAVQGGIVASGFNLKFGKYVTESGGFALISPSPQATPFIYQQVDRQHQPGKSLAEKRIAGKYLGPALTIAVKHLRRQGLLDSSLTPGSSEFISEILSSPPAKFMASHSLNSSDYATFRFLSQELAFNSAILVGNMIGTGIATFAPDYPDNQVRFPIEGPVFWEIPDYRSTVEVEANRLLQPHSKTVTCIPGNGLVGATQIALSLLA